MNVDFEQRRRIASFCDTAMRIVMVLEDVAPEAEKGSRLRSEIEAAAKKLRSAVIAATDPLCPLIQSGGSRETATEPVLSCTDAITVGSESPASGAKLNSSDPEKRSSCEPSEPTPCSSGGSSSTEADSRESTAPYSAMNPSTAAQNSFARRTRLLNASGLLAGITPTSARKTSGQATLDFASSPPAGDGAGSPAAD